MIINPLDLPEHGMFTHGNRNYFIFCIFALTLHDLKSNGLEIDYMMGTQASFTMFV